MSYELLAKKSQSALKLVNLWHSYGLKMVGLLAVVLIVLVLGLTVGSYPVSWQQVVTALGSALQNAPLDDHQLLIHDVIFTIRLPRVLAAVVVGMALATAGSAYQAIFRNPLVSPGILGVLSGAAFGATLGMLLHQSDLWIQVWAFGFGLLAVMVGLLIGQMFGGASLIMLILGGMLSSALFGAFLSIIKYLADPTDELPSITYWLMGSLGMTSLSETLWLAIPIVISTLLLWMLGRSLDILSMGDQEALSLGVPVKTVRYVVIALATLISALSVSIAGMIGWIGLLAPHIARLVLGPMNTRLLPASTLLGAAFLVLADCVARTAAQVEIPIGIVTECMGLPMFLLVLHRAKQGWN